MENAPLPDLQRLREAIERVDGDILESLRRRKALAEDIARAKLANASPFRDPTREELVLQRVRARATEHALDPHEVERLYRLIIEMSVAQQQALLQTLDTTPLRVGYPGLEGSYSHLAAQKRYAHRPGGVLLTGYDSAWAVASSLERAETDVGLLPIENTSAGSMNETYDVLASGKLSITAELVSRVDHRLLGLPGARLEDVRVVLSHPQAFSQCEAFLRTVPFIRQVPEFDTAGAARRVKDTNDPSLAAIASESAGERFGLAVLVRDVHAAQANYTRFVEVARESAAVAPGAACKTSLLIVLDHRPGALGQVLMHFTQRGVNLTKLESRPLPDSSWKYRFYLDLEGHAASAPLAAALEDIRPLTSQLTVLGTYARADAHA